MSDVDRLRLENRRLREENVELVHEVAQLREALAIAGPTTNATTATPHAPATPATKLIGRWRGGTIRDGNAFITDFADDNTYRQTWLTAPHREAGHWSMPSDDIVEMWTSPGGDNQPHNRWRASFAKDQITLTPLTPDGVDLPGAKPLVLQSVPQ